MGSETRDESQRHVPCSDRPGGARLCRVRSSTDVHHAARMGWGVGGRARRGKAGQGGARRGMQGASRIESSAEDQLEEKRGAVGPGLIATCDGLSLERRGNTRQSY